VSWSRDIAPLVQARCVRCHRPDGRGPMPLLTYEDARPWARAIREEVLTRRMPKWHAARGYGDFANDPSLSPFEIALVVAWVDGGAPKDPPRNAPAGIAPESARPLRAFAPPSAAREVTVPCQDQALPVAELAGIRPRLVPGASAGFSVSYKSGRREILGWIRDFDPGFEETYWLRRPLGLYDDPRLSVESDAPCSVTLILK
jgi:hypothetical protein